MNYELTLSLELREQNGKQLVFGLCFLNRSVAKLLLPDPGIDDLRFVNKATLKESNWHTEYLVELEWGGFMLGPGQSKTIEYRVRPTSVESPPENGTEYYRWSVDLPSGEYLVWFGFRVGEDYFCPDSHFRIGDLNREAERSGAVVWMGEVKSNRLHVLHTEFEAGREA